MVLKMLLNYYVDFSKLWLASHTWLDKIVSRLNNKDCDHIIIAMPEGKIIMLKIKYGRNL